MAFNGGEVEQHYTSLSLFDKITGLFQKQGIERITLKHLSMLDQFHLRGAAASMELAREAELIEKDHVLDVGCGIGGPARMLANNYGCTVTGIDITQEFVNTATRLSQLTGMDDKTRFVCGDALALPFPDNTFDAVWTQHVQMNVEDKKKFYGEIHRVLKKEGSLIFHDIFCNHPGSLKYPVPWASSEKISHLISTSQLHQLLTSLGFYIRQTRDQTDAAIGFLSENNEPVTDTIPFSPQILMGENGREKLSNLLQNFREGKLTVQSGVFRKE